MEKKGKTKKTNSDIFEEYLDKLIGVIKFDDPKLNFEYLYSIDSARLIQSKHAIKAMLQSVSSEKIMIMFNKETRGVRNFSEIDALDLEILLNHLVLGILVSIKNKNKACLKHYQDKVLFLEDPDLLQSNHAIIYSASFYDHEVTRLINEKNARIAELVLENQPSTQLSNELTNKFLSTKKVK